MHSSQPTPHLHGHVLYLQNTFEVKNDAETSGYGNAGAKKNVWVFIRYQLTYLIHPYELPATQYWEDRVALDDRE